MKVLAFDIETVPDVETGRRLHDFAEPNISDEDVVRALEQLQYQKTGNTFLPHYLHRIVVVSVLFVRGEEIRIKSLSGDEAGIVADFFNGIERSVPRLVTWNGTRFDLPVLHYRALLHGVSAQRYWEIGDDDREFRYNNYLSRFHWRHIDLMDVLGAYDPRSFAPLDSVAKMLGLPGKQIMDGSGVWDCFRAGELQKICDYCEIDVVNTFLIYLRFEMMRGTLIPAEYQAHCENLAEFMRHSEREHLVQYAGDWTASGEFALTA